MGEDHARPCAVTYAVEPPRLSATRANSQSVSSQQIAKWCGAPRSGLERVPSPDQPWSAPTSGASKSSRTRGFPESGRSAAQAGEDAPMRSAVVRSSRNRKARGGIHPAAAAPSLDRNFGGRSRRARGACAPRVPRYFAPTRRRFSPTSRIFAVIARHRW